MKKEILNLKTLFSSLFLFFASFSVAIANTEVAWPDSPTIEFRRDMPLHELIAYFYEWGIIIGILLVFGILVFSGFQYTISAGKPAVMQDALSRIQSAVIGLVLLLSSWVILSMINPELVRISPVTFSIHDEVYISDLSLADLEGEPVDIMEFYAKKNHEDHIATVYIRNKDIYNIQLEADEIHEDHSPKSVKGYTAIPPDEMKQLEDGISLGYQRYSPPVEIEQTMGQGGDIIGIGSHQAERFGPGEKMRPDPRGLYKEGGTSIADLYEATANWWEIGAPEVACGEKLSRGSIPTVDLEEGIFGFGRSIDCMEIERRQEREAIGTTDPEEGAVEISRTYCRDSSPNRCYSGPLDLPDGIETFTLTINPYRGHIGEADEDDWGIELDIMRIETKHRPPHHGYIDCGFVEARNRCRTEIPEHRNIVALHEVGSEWWGTTFEWSKEGDPAINDGYIPNIEMTEDVTINVCWEGLWGLYSCEEGWWE